MSEQAIAGEEFHCEKILVKVGVKAMDIDSYEELTTDVVLSTLLCRVRTA